MTYLLRIVRSCKAVYEWRHVCVRGGSVRRAQGSGELFQVTDEGGKTLKLYFDHPYKVEYLDENNNVMGKIEQHADAVLLMMHHALSYFHSDEDNVPIFYHEQRASIEFIEQVKSFWAGLNR